jgi:sugar/nucleoside kinase (ribokinase family)
MAAMDPLKLAAFFRSVRQAGAKTVLDVVLPGGGDHWAQIAPVLPETDVFLPNEDEARAITGLDNPLDQAERLLAVGAGTVVITCGSRGSVLATKGLRLSAKCYQVKYVGGTGAGDAFDAGYIAALLHGGDPRTCLTWGSAIGASCVRDVSATDGVFSRAEAESFIKTQELQIEVI